MNKPQTLYESGSQPAFVAKLWLFLAKPVGWALLLTLLFLLGKLLPAWKFFDTPLAYLPLHTTLEVFTISISGMLFFLAWSLRDTRLNSHLFLLGTGFLAVGLIDLAHVLSYAGMPDFVTPSGSEKAINFWLTARYVAAVVILYVALSAARSWTLMVCWLVLLGGLTITAGVWWLVLAHGSLMPRTFIPGQGLTAFKVGAEYLVGFVYAISAILLLRRSRGTHNVDLQWLAAAAWVMMLAEMFFTLYGNVTDIFNLLGHVYKTIAYAMIYRGLFVVYVKRPYAELERERTELRKFSLTVEQTPESVVITDLNARIEYVNEAFMRKTGYSREEVYGRNPRVLHSGKTPRETFRDMWDTLTSGRVWSGEFVNRNKMGEEYIERALIAPIRQPDGRITHYLAIKEDITERRAIERELRAHRDNLQVLVEARAAELARNEARLRSILASMADGVVQISCEGKILMVNKSLLRIFGYEEQELIGKNVNILMPEPHHSRHDGYLQRYVRERTARILGSRVELSAIRKDGTVIVVELVTNELRDENGTSFIGVLHDITQRKMAEQQLMQAKDTAESATRAKSDFLANMSHEIRTPLNGVLGLAQIGMREGSGKMRDLFTRISDSGQHLLLVVNDILDFSKIEAGKLSVEAQPFALKAVIDGVASLLTPQAEDKGLKLSASMAPGLPVWVKGDALRLSQILSNLLSNAIKFSESGAIRLQVSNGEQIEFKVIDDGIGMDEAQLSRLFQPFEQADASATRRFGGSGLGLAISRNLAHLMGGDISVSSTLGKGSTFVLRLPLPPAEAVVETVRQGEEGRQRLYGLRVLAAEDVEVNRLVLEDMLTQEGAHVVFAVNGRQAVERLEEQGVAAFDVALMDIQMPLMDGWEATRRIHKLAPALPVIGLTAHAMAEERERCLNAGMVDHVTKPIQKDVLITSILRHVTQSGHSTVSASSENTAPLPESAPESASVIDWPGLLARYQGRQDFVAKLAATVLESNAEASSQLHAAVQQGDMAGIAFQAHKIKGIAGNLDANRVRELAAATEAAAREGRSAAASLATELTGEMENMLAELAEHYPPGRDG